MGFMSVAKPLSLAVCGGSGDLLDGWVAFRPAREAPLGPTWGASAGFGARAGVPIFAKNAETTRWTRIGLRRPVS